MATAVHPHDEHASHLKLEYQPGLPMPLGKTIIWLFLSTEIMFFAGLIGTYVVLRFGAPTWPRPHEVHLSEPIGAFNTFVLICSSVTVVLALEAAHANRSTLAKLLTFITLCLGCVFLGVKAYEYNAQIRARNLSLEAAQPNLRKTEPGIWFGRARAAENAARPVRRRKSGYSKIADRRSKGKNRRFR